MPAAPIGYAPARVRQPLDKLTVRSLICAALCFPCLFATVSFVSAHPSFGIPAGCVSFMLAVLAVAWGARARDRVAVAGMTLGSLEILLAVVVAVFYPMALAAADRTRCAANLRAIGYGLDTYRNGNRGEFPPGFSPLSSSQGFPPQVFLCPATSGRAVSGLTVQSALGPVPCSYVYVRPTRKSAEIKPDEVLAYEPLANHGGSGSHVLFGDGRVEWLRASDAKRVIEGLEMKAGAGAR